MLIDFIRGPRSKAKAKAKKGTANKKQTVRVNLRGGGMATGGMTRLPMHPPWSRKENPATVVLDQKEEILLSNNKWILKLGI